MVTMKTKPVMDGTEPAIQQPMVNGWHMSYNPDDARWYVCAAGDGIAAATFAQRRNAIQYARSHENKL